MQNQDSLRWNAIRRRVIEHNTFQAVELLKRYDIESIVIKGIAVGRYYPIEQLRDSVDVDLAVDPAVFDKALTIVKENAGLGLAIDLHRGLRSFGDLDWQSVLHASELVELTAGSIRVLRPELHLIVLCHHWLLDGGRYRNRLHDIKYLIEAERNDFNWDEFLSHADSRRIGNYRIAIGLAAREFEIDLSNTPMKGVIETIPAWVTAFLRSEWTRDFEHLPLESSIIAEGRTLDQLADRLSPNPIRAIIEFNGDLTTNRRKTYQVLNFFYRIPSTISRIGWVIYHEWRLKRQKRS